MIATSACRPWQPDRAADTAQHAVATPRAGTRPAWLRHGFAPRPLGNHLKQGANHLHLYPSLDERWVTRQYRTSHAVLSDLCTKALQSTLRTTMPHATRMPRAPPRTPVSIRQTCSSTSRRCALLVRIAILGPYRDVKEYSNVKILALILDESCVRSKDCCRRWHRNNRTSQWLVSYSILHAGRYGSAGAGGGIDCCQHHGRVD